MIHSVLRRVILDALSEKSLMSGCGKGKIKGKGQRICPELASFTGLFFGYIKDYQETSSNNEGNTETLRNMRKPFHQLCNFVTEISRPKTGEEPSRKEAQKKVIPWLRSFGMEEIETPRGFQKSQRQYYLCLIKWIKRQEKFGEIAGQ